MNSLPFYQTDVELVLNAENRSSKPDRIFGHKAYWQGDYDVVEYNNMRLLFSGILTNWKELYTMLDRPFDETIETIVLVYYERYGLEYTLSCLRGSFVFFLIDNRVMTGREDTLLYVVTDAIPLQSVYQVEDDTSHIHLTLNREHQQSPNDIRLFNGSVNEYVLSNRLLSSWKAKSSWFYHANPWSRPVWTATPTPTLAELVRPLYDYVVELQGTCVIPYGQDRIEELYQALAEIHQGGVDHIVVDGQKALVFLPATIADPIPLYVPFFTDTLGKMEEEGPLVDCLEEERRTLIRWRTTGKWKGAGMYPYLGMSWRRRWDK